MEPLYLIKSECANCGNVFSTSRVRPSFKRTVRMDSDFYKTYRDVNPDYYIVKVCPLCGFSSTEHFSVKLTAEHRQAIEEQITLRWGGKDFGGARDSGQAMAVFKLALFCAQIVGEKDRVIAGMLHHIAWLYRTDGNAEQEKKFLGFALEAYIRVYEREGIDINNARLMFLIGELNRRLKRYSEAVRWFSRVVNDKRIMDSGMIQCSRAQWAVLREEMLADKAALTEEEMDMIREA